jgi:hypothetical protein
MSDDINTLRSELFATIRALRDSANPMDIARAKAVSDVAQTIINSAKVEVDMINAVGNRRMSPSKFLGAAGPDTLMIQQRDAAEPIPGRGLPSPAPKAKL